MELKSTWCVRDPKAKVIIQNAPLFKPCGLFNIVDDIELEVT